MRFTVDAWDPGYGSSDEVGDDLADTDARVVTDVELPTERWRPLDPEPDTQTPDAMLFVDGVRRIDARVWVTEPDSDGDISGGAGMGLCASYAAGVVCCCASDGAHVAALHVTRGLFTAAAHAQGITTSAGPYHACSTSPAPDQPLPAVLSGALQQRLADLEATVAQDARAAAGHDHQGDLLVLDGPLRGRTHLPRTIGFIKSHRTAYLPPPLSQLLAALTGGQRTPVFRIGTSWDRHSWYLRLPCRPGPPMGGLVRLECSPDIPTGQAITLANQSAAMLCRYASEEYKDPRAPQNLYPIAGLERQLRRRLGDSQLLLRALRVAASAGYR